MLLLLAGCGVEVNLRGLNKLGVGPTKQRNTPQIKHAPHVAIPVHHTSHLLNTPPTFHAPLARDPGDQWPAAGLKMIPESVGDPQRMRFRV